MKTQDELRRIQLDSTRYVRELSRLLTKAKMKPADPRLLRSVEIATLRLNHLYHLVSHSFNKVLHRKNKFMYMRPIKGSYRDVLKHKYVDTCLSIMQLISEEKIDLNRWFLAQAETITIPVFTPHQCFGYNALSRYSHWESRQQLKFQREEDRKSQTDSKDKTIHKSILESHLTALKWEETLKQIDPPSLGAALWYLWPSVSVWYLLAHKSFNDDVMSLGFVTNASLVTQWKTYLRSPHVREVCETALHEAEDIHGKLQWKS